MANKKQHRVNVYTHGLVDQYNQYDNHTCIYHIPKLFLTSSFCFDKNNQNLFSWRLSVYNIVLLSAGSMAGIEINNYFCCIRETSRVLTITSLCHTTVPVSCSASLSLAMQISLIGETLQVFVFVYLVNLISVLSSKSIHTIVSGKISLSFEGK